MFEIALSCGLLVAAGLMIKSVAKMRDDGYRASSAKNVFTARIGFPVGVHRHDRRSGSSSIRSSTACRRIARRASRRRSAPDCPAARQGFNGNAFAIEGQTLSRRTRTIPNTRSASVTPDFFTTLTIPTLQGRAFNDGRPRRLAAGRRRRTRRSSTSSSRTATRSAAAFGSAARRAQQPWVTIVGVVGNVFTGDQQNPMAPAVCSAVRAGARRTSSTSPRRRRARR